MAGEAARAGSTGAGRIVVIGAGAIGLLYAIALAGVRPDRVCVVTRRPQARDAIRAGGQLLWSDGTTRAVAMLDACLPEDCPAAAFDVALIAVAAYDSRWAGALAARLLNAGGIAITLQNGLDNQAALAESLGERAIQGATSFPVHLDGAARVRISTRAATWLPPLAERFGWLNDWLREADLNPQTIADPVALGWRKTVVGMNGYLSLAFATPMGRVMQQEDARHIVEQASLEALAIATASGVALDRDDILRALRAAWNTSPDTRSSLYSDYLAGRRTELDERLGSLVERGRALGQPVTVLDMLYRLCRVRLGLREEKREEGSRQEEDRREENPRKGGA